MSQQPTKGVQGGQARKVLRGQVSKRLVHARAKETAAAPVVRAKPKAKVVNIGEYVEALILRGKSTEEVLMDVQKRFPEARTQKASVYWYRSKLHKEGKF